MWEGGEEGESEEGGVWEGEEGGREGGVKSESECGKKEEVGPELLTV